MLESSSQNCCFNEDIKKPGIIFMIPGLNTYFPVAKIYFFKLDVQSRCSHPVDKIKNIL